MTVSVTEKLSDLTTPCFLIDRKKMQANIRRLADHIGALGGVIRPHVKTHKSIEVTRDMMAAGHMQGITVSTLQEAEYFFAAGFTDILYAVGMAPNKLSQVKDLIDRGCDLKVILDNLDMADYLADFASQASTAFRVLIEIDTDDHRSGVKPLSDDLIAIGQRLEQANNVSLEGVMTHAGESYYCETPESQLAIARQERDLSVQAAERLRAAGLPCPTVSIGSTPTAFAIDDLDGITEVRAGVYVFFDLVMAGLGICQIDEIAGSVLTSVIGYQRDKNWMITDAGWMAMSRDRGTADQQVDQGYGLVTDIAGQPLADLLVSSANQEHGIVTPRDPESALDYTACPIGSLLRVLPNHACSTAAQYQDYVVVDGEHIIDHWSSTTGW